MLDNAQFLPGSVEAQQGIQEELHSSLSVENDESDEEIDEVALESNMQSEHSSQSCQSSIYDVEKMAIKLLAIRAFTAFELRKKLQAKKFPLYMVNDVIMDLLSRGFINDSLYAESFSRSRWSSSTWGPSRIKQALSQKGISRVDAEKAVKLVFLESDPNTEEEEPIMGLSKLSMDHLLAQATKKWDRSGNIPNEKRKARVISWLQYRGFNWGVIGFVLKKLEAKYSPL
ncbi:regulatory protein RecX [Impatiens glandulifera]|uniref:regulatory protein RecX n=1 Tax=Impatiens glandulifera TaxID=253017 RepID=UPI001FB0CBCB|nr:regulatory protein RecX [Impatiens glandulifera]